VVQYRRRDRRIRIGAPTIPIPHSQYSPTPPSVIPLNLNPAPLLSQLCRRPVQYETVGDRRERQVDLVDWKPTIANKKTTVVPRFVCQREDSTIGYLS
jgi:hypothetical protein